MRISILVSLVTLMLCGSVAADGLKLIAFFPMTDFSQRREVRIVSNNPSLGQYQACVTDSDLAVKILNIDPNSLEFKSDYVQNTGTTSYATVIQGLSKCGYSALISPTTLFNVIGDDTNTSDLAQLGSWLYAVWSDNQVQTFIYTGTAVVNRFNATTPGPYNYVIASDGMNQLGSWELYQEPVSLTTFIAYSLTVFNNTALKSVVHKCNPDCTRVMTLGTSVKDATMAANSTHWFSCYKEITKIDVSGNYMCTVSGLPEWTFNITQFDLDNPIGTSDGAMYSCMLDSDTLVVMLTFDTIDTNYTLYTLKPSTAFSINSTYGRSNTYATSLTCIDKVVLVGTSDGVDVYSLENRTEAITLSPLPAPFSINTPIVNQAPINAPVDTSHGTPEPLNAPVFFDTPIVTPNSAVNQNDTNFGELSANDKIAVGVVIGVGVPLIAGAVVLILFRKKLNKKPPKDEEGSVYTAINNKVHKLIPFKEVAFTKEIGAGSYAKVFLGTWQGKKVAVKMNHRVVDTDVSMAEARLMLSVPLHPNLVETYGISMDTDHPYIVLEFCEGGSLDKIVFNKTIGHKEQRSLVVGIAQGLLHLHSNKIVHRDLAVRNILLKDGVPKISDFGMSRVLKDESEQGKTKNTVGPIRWMAPESIRDMTYSPKSDVWTFGIVVSEIVLGHEPHHDKNQLDIAVKIRDTAYTPEIPDNSDPVLKELMQMCWKMNPDDRPTMEEIIKFLDKYL